MLVAEANKIRKGKRLFFLQHLLYMISNNRVLTESWHYTFLVA